jgi:hypothetical protein
MEWPNGSNIDNATILELRPIRDRLLIMRAAQKTAGENWPAGSVGQVRSLTVNSHLFCAIGAIDAVPACVTFHALNGWFFQRTATGSVRIFKYRDPNGTTLEAEVELPADVWASVVASVTRIGETAETWQQALKFHDHGTHLLGVSKEACQHGTAMDVHCCNCHNGYLFERDHECEPVMPAPAVPAPADAKEKP